MRQGRLQQTLTKLHASNLSNRQYGLTCHKFLTNLVTIDVEKPFACSPNLNDYLLVSWEERVELDNERRSLLALIVNCLLT